VSGYKKPSPKVSVITPVYNTGKYLVECLDSVLTQTFVDFEIICIDDGSTDNSLNILRDYVKEKNDQRIKIMTQKNAGVVSARNNAIAVAGGEYIFPLDSDDKIAPTCLEILYNFITTHDYAIVVPSGILFGERNGYWDLPKITKLNMYSFNNGIHNSSLFPRRLWEKYGGYDHLCEDWEDYDFWLNFIDDGQKAIRIQDRLFYYRQKDKSESRNKCEKDRDAHNVLHANLRRKHPNINKYSRIAKLLRIPRKIARLFYRSGIEKDGYFTIKVFKIPVYRRRVQTV
jgi:glycosyltransferase involved in cell wall biosynthesis